MFKSLALLASLSLAPLAAADEAELFAMARSGVYIIQVADNQTSAESVIGSGFLVGDELIATNYHVISRHLLHSDRHTLRMETSDEVKVPLEVVAVDVIHDLALVAPTEHDLDFQSMHRFEIATELPAQGSSLSAIGNPYDVGMSIVPGTHNGAVRHSYQGRLHFTGALNPGMSGGPAVDSDGRVVGVNVAGAGNSVSFLVPARHLSALIERSQQSETLDYDALNAVIRQDLDRYQRQLMDDLLSRTWELEDLGPVRVPREFADYVSCSGNGSDPDDPERFDWHELNCGSYDRIFLSPQLNTGTVEMDYLWHSTQELGGLRFYQVLDGQGFVPLNTAGPDDVTPFECHDDIIEIDALARQDFKTVFCVRAYLDYEGFYDVLMAARSVFAKDESITLHYTLAGVTQDTARRFNDAFVGAIQWK